MQPYDALTKREEKLLKKALDIQKREGDNVSLRVMLHHVGGKKVADAYKRAIK